MSIEEMKQDLREMFDILKSLNAENLALVKGGAMVLKAKQDMESAYVKDRNYH